MSTAIFPTPRSFAGVTLNRRGRALMRTLVVAGTVTLLAISALVLALGFSSGVQAQAGDSVTASEVNYVVVGQDETLWDIAATTSGSQDTRDVMTQIVELNALSTSVIQPGQRLAVPAVQD